VHASEPSIMGMLNIFFTSVIPENTSDCSGLSLDVIVRGALANYKALPDVRPHTNEIWDCTDNTHRYVQVSFMTAHCWVKNLTTGAYNVCMDQVAWYCKLVCTWCKDPDYVISCTGYDIVPAGGPSCTWGNFNDGQCHAIPCPLEN